MLCMYTATRTAGKPIYQYHEFRHRSGLVMKSKNDGWIVRASSSGTITTECRFTNVSQAVDDFNPRRFWRAKGFEFASGVNVVASSDELER
jgi:hypothetical protein